MRRLNIRKRNRLNLELLNQKALKTLGVLVILILVFTGIYFYFIKNIFIKGNFEKEYTALSNMNENTPFSLKEITIFSSATAIPKEVTNSVWNLDISQYADIGIYLSNSQEDVYSIQAIYIDNIQISNAEYGTPCLYQKSMSDFGKCSFDKKLIINDRIDLDTNLSAPILLGYYNENIKENFLDSSSKLEYNGTLLKRASIPQTSIQRNISFDVHISTHSAEEYVCNISLDIPLENQDQSVYEDGYVIKKLENLENYKFLRLK